jgi:serine O-acetyltransferase
MTSTTERVRAAATSVPAISSEVPDWSRETIQPGEWSPGKRLLAAIRDYQRLGHDRTPLRWMGRRWAVLRHRFWSAVAGADIPLNARIGGGLMIPHPNGIVIHSDSVIGPNCLILQQVTIGTRAEGGPLVLGGHVDVGAGAKILGPVRIGAHAIIGANAVVLRNVPEGATAVGIPATCIEPPTD